jgi:KilA-N domain
MEKYIPVEYVDEKNETSQEITFLKGDKHNMINATEMIKSFPDKQIGNFLFDKSRRIHVEKICLRNSQVINDIGIPTTLSISELGNYFPESIKVVRGGSDIHKQGTWFHHSIAYELARWLSPDFSIWCNDRIDELFKKGVIYLKNNHVYDIDEHVIPQVQRENCKAIGRELYFENKDHNEIIKHHRKIMYIFTGKYPHEIVAWARKQDYIPTSICNKGSREILRFINHSTPACISLLENIITCNPDLSVKDINEYLPVVKEAKNLFNRLIAIGHMKERDFNINGEIKKLN